MEDPLRITGSVRIPLREIEFRTSRSSGPGGQHANVTASRVEAIFDVRRSHALDRAQRERVVDRLGPVVRGMAQDARSQARNRDLAGERLVERLRKALYVAPSRRPTRPTRAAKRRRLEAKDRRSRTKRDRRPPGADG